VIGRPASAGSEPEVLPGHRQGLEVAADARGGAGGQDSFTEWRRPTGTASVRPTREFFWKSFLSVPPIVVRPPV
jgi:hypothetical protein